ncbi:MAG: hypothetical protein HOO91_20740 [Bacteroidales bacterium]|nr:hypothetical protein [Bacteroidales bacterium]
MKKLKLDRLTSTRFDVNELIKIKGGLLICACGPFHQCYCLSEDSFSDATAQNTPSRFDIKTAQ